MDLHSTLVAWAKTVLPLGALALLSTLFLIARAPQVDEDAIPYADIDALARDQQVSAPAFSGVADDGSIIAITADRARPVPGQDGALTLTAIRGEVTAPGGDRLTLTAPDGALDTTAQTAALAGPVRIATTTGTRIETGAVTADLDAGRLEAAGPLTATLPFGSLEAGGLIAETPEGGGPRLVFHHGVRLVYRRDPSESPPE